MKHTRIYASIFMVAAAVSLASCGGGGDAEAGSPTAFSVQPTTFTFTAFPPSLGGPPAGLCASTDAGEYFVYGGAAPYRLDNPNPDSVVLDRTTVSERGGSFKVRFVGPGCVSPALIIIVDKLDNQVVLTLNNKPSGGT
ncbi:MAG TPA: hypothetical protein VFA35_09775 [Burkholderiaceae bacterium]|nr:hypothetical protein [Burkholderiaceae bacterium]